MWTKRRRPFLVIILAVLLVLGGISALASEQPAIREEKIEFSEEERAYIESSSDRKIRLICLVTRPPLSYAEKGSGAPAGICIDLMRWIEANTGLSFEYIPLSAGGQPVDYVKQGYADIAVGVFNYGANLTDSDIMMTDTFFASEMVMVAKKGVTIDMSKPLKVLVNKGYRIGYQLLEESYPYYDIEYCDAVEDGLEAVQNGGADLAFQNVYVMNEYLKRPAYSNLAMIGSTYAEENLACAVSAREDRLLVDILNKAIAKIPAEYKHQLIVDYTVTRMYYPTFAEYIKNNLPVFIAAVMSVVFLITAVILTITLRNRKKVIALVKRSGDYVKNIADNIDGGMVSIIWENEFVIVYSNDCFFNMTGMGRFEYKREKKQSFIRFFDDAEAFKLEELFNRAWDNNEPISVKTFLKTKDGKLAVMLKGSVSNDLDGRRTILCMIMDIQHEMELRLELEDEKEMYRIYMDEVRDIIFFMDWETKRIHWPSVWEEKFGYKMSTTYDSSDETAILKNVVHDDDIPAVRKAISEIRAKNSIAETGIRIREMDGDYRWYQLQLKRMNKNGSLYRILGKLTDIDSETRHMQKLSDESMHDKLTTLYNKEAFYTLVNAYLKKDNASGMLMFLDLDNFKLVNDKMGHLAGDEILKSVAYSLKAAFRNSDIIARFGGDEFVVFAKGIGEKSAEAKAMRLQDEVLRIREDCGAQDTGLSVCIGVSAYPSDAENIEELLQKADEAMYFIKQNGKNGYAFYKKTI